MGPRIPVPCDPLPEKPPKGHFTFANRQVARLPWWRGRNMPTLHFYIVVLILTNTANGFEGSMMNGLQSLTYSQEYVDDPRGAIFGFFNGSMLIGGLLALFVTRYITDWRGGKIGLVISSVLMLIDLGPQSGAQNFGIFVAASYHGFRGRYRSRVGASPYH